MYGIKHRAQHARVQSQGKDGVVAGAGRCVADRLSAVLRQPSPVR